VLRPDRQPGFEVRDETRSLPHLEAEPPKGIDHVPAAQGAQHTMVAEELRRSGAEPRLELDRIERGMQPEAEEWVDHGCVRSSGRLDSPGARVLHPAALALEGAVGACGARRGGQSRTSRSGRLRGRGERAWQGSVPSRRRHSGAKEARPRGIPGATSGRARRESAKDRSQGRGRSRASAPQRRSTAEGASGSTAPTARTRSAGPARVPRSPTSCSACPTRSRRARAASRTSARATSTDTSRTTGPSLRA
jgi:hypothetical protein